MGILTDNYSENPKNGSAGVFETLDLVNNFETGTFEYRSESGEEAKTRKGLRGLPDTENISNRVMDMYHSRRKYFSGEDWRLEFYESEQKLYMTRSFDKAVEPHELTPLKRENIRSDLGTSPEDILEDRGHARVVLKGVKDFDEVRKLLS